MQIPATRSRWDTNGTLMQGLKITALDAAAFVQRSVRLDTEIDIHRAPDQVFAFVTTPALWRQWHPATRSVRDVPDRPMVKGETIVEHIAFMGRSSEARWTVLVCDAPLRWEIGTDTAAGTAHIVYRVTATSTGCRFYRTLNFRSKQPLWRMLDSTLTRWILQRQSARALANLKAVLEG